ncbi:hypothetical protein LOTGIDRAFT_233210 [Lottia gigantea]|uniref:CUB domain-containing protein n=1 Tax=Lottia gigantea TaxID=225164 RepID=V4BSV1_LOTGI|nr:hypothetical protein LOTGIDRAFT_233210 [Lottia gigantea]ESO92154.1 hypothetical protein LOTGIDRAFT_233210 [Lottia gigantea]
MKLIICLMFLMSTFTDSDGLMKQNCNESLCFLCGCGDETVFNVSCKNKNQVIQMEPFIYHMKTGASDSDDCPLDSYETCKESDSTSILNKQDRIEVYKNCMLKTSCEINIQERIKTGNKRWVNFPLYCHDKSFIKDISNKIVKNRLYQAFFFSGEKFVGQKIDCDCSITSSKTLYLTIFFINLKPDTCPKVKFLNKNQNLLNCSETTMLNTYYGYTGSEFKLEIRGLQPDVEDMIVFKLRTYDKWWNMFVNCSGCRNSTDPTTTDIPITTDVSTKYIPVSRPLATVSSTKGPAIIVNPTRNDHAPTTGTDQTNNVDTAILGGILAAVIIIVIVGIALYCFIRRRKKQEKTRKTLAYGSGNSEQFHYDYVDVPQDTQVFNHIRLTENIVVQNDNHRRNSQFRRLVADSGEENTYNDNSNSEPDPTNTDVDTYNRNVVPTHFSGV